MALTNRADCLHEIRRLIGDDAFMARLALLTALNLLDLEGVNSVLGLLEARADDPRWGPAGRLARLLEERYG